MITKVLLGKGVVQYTAWGNEDISPEGFVQATFTKTQGGKITALLLYAVTIEAMRRKGICTSIFQAISEDCDVMLSPVGSGSGGRQVMEKFGFILDPDLDIWVFRKRG